MNAAIQAKTLSEQEILRLIRSNERAILDAQNTAHNLCRDNTLLRAELNNRSKKAGLYGVPIGGYPATSIAMLIATKGK